MCISNIIYDYNFNVYCIMYMYYSRACGTAESTLQMNVFYSRVYTTT